MNDTLADLHLALGRNYKYLDIYDLAVSEFNRAIALKPDDPRPYIETALTYLRTGDYAKAAQYAQQAIQADPSDPLLYGYYGTILFRSQDYNAALTPLRIATRGGLAEDGTEVNGMLLDETSMYIYARFGLSLARTGACGEALQISQALTQAFPDDETNLSNASEMVVICQEQAGVTPTVPEATPTP